MRNIAVVLALVAVLGVCSANVLKFSPHMIEDETDELMKFLSKPILPERYKPKSFFERWGRSSKPMVGSFVWKACGGSGAEFTALSETPDPLKLPGTFRLAAKAVVNTTIQAPLQTNLTIEKKVGTQWVKIPCIDQFGSCSYDDLCDILYSATCPDAFTKAGIPCTCPLKPGTYSLPATNLTTYLAFPAGDYHLHGAIGMNGKMTGCLDLYLSISSS